MTAHEKWLHKNYGGCSKNLSFRYSSRMGWEAALKWALKQRCGPLGGEVIPINNIKKELNGDAESK